MEKISLMQEMKKRYPKIQWRLVLAGDEGNDDLKVRQKVCPMWKTKTHDEGRHGDEADHSSDGRRLREGGRGCR